MGDIAPAGRLRPFGPRMQDEGANGDYAPKGQHLIAQGNALGMKAEMVTAPCKGSTFKTPLILPLRGAVSHLCELLY